MKKRSINELRRRKQFLRLRNSLKNASGLIVISILCLGLLYTGWRLLLKNPHFFIKKISSTIAFDELSVLQRKLQKTSLFQTPLSKYASFIKKNHPEFKYVQLEKVFPNTLKITIVDRKPLAQILINRKYFIIDEEGILLNDGTAERDPSYMEITDQIINVPIAQKGTRINIDEVTAALELLKELRSKRILNKYPLVSVISISSLSTIYFTMAGVVIQVGEPPYAEKIALLADTLLPQFKGGLQDLKQIDLRFTPPVIGYRR